MVVTRSGSRNYNPDKIRIKIQRTDRKSIWPNRFKKSGFYLNAFENVTIPVGEMRKIRTGLTIEIPKGYHGVMYTDSPIIDECDDYDGYLAYSATGFLHGHSCEEIKIVYNNLSKTDVTIKRGCLVGYVILYKNIDYQLDRILEIDRYDASRV